jgi:hypothetical protein
MLRAFGHAGVVSPSCSAMFALCASCDRGQRYCSELWRSRRRGSQVRAAGKRYQASEAGKHALSTTASLPRGSQHSARDASSYGNDHRADYFRTALVGSVRHLRVVEPLDEPLLPARTAQAAATVGAMFKFQRFPMIANRLALGRLRRSSRV